MRRTSHKHTLNLTYFIYYATIQGMSEQFITPTQPEDKLKDTPGNSDWDTVADFVSREVGASKGLAIDPDTLPLTHAAMGLPSPEKKEETSPDSATDSTPQGAVDLPSELDSDNKQV